MLNVEYIMDHLMMCIFRALFVFSNHAQGVQHVVKLAKARPQEASQINLVLFTR